jgi:hypothetical protein
MKKIAILCLALAASFAAFASNAQAREWRYAGHAVTGVFSANPANPVQWFERVSDGVTFTFTETEKNVDYLELFDASRGVTVRLYADASYIRYAATGGRFDFLNNGRWVAALQRTWMNNVKGMENSTWTFTPLGDGRFSAQEVGLGYATGTAVLTGDHLRIDFTTSGGAGYYDVDLNADGTAGSGQCVQTQGPLAGNTYRVAFQR